MWDYAAEVSARLCGAYFALCGGFVLLPSNIHLCRSCASLTLCLYSAERWRLCSRCAICSGVSPSTGARGLPVGFGGVGFASRIALRFSAALRWVSLYSGVSRRAAAASFAISILRRSIAASYSAAIRAERSAGVSLRGAGVVPLLAASRASSEASRAFNSVLSCAQYSEGIKSSIAIISGCLVIISSAPTSARFPPNRKPPRGAVARPVVLLRRYCRRFFALWGLHIPLRRAFRVSPLRWWGVPVPCAAKS